jgi:hypothetical protein
MPTKFKPSQKTFIKSLGKTRTEHFYIKSMNKYEIFKEINNKNTRPKVKQKLLNELARRRIEVVWNEPKEA